MPQVIYAWNYVEWGGAQIHLLAIIREAVKKYDVKVLLPRGSNPQLLKFIDETGVKVSFFDDAVHIGDAVGVMAKIRRHWAKVKSEYAMLKALKRGGLADTCVVHVDLAPWQSLFALVWLSLRIPVFVTMHNSLGKVSPARRLLWKIKLRIISRFGNFHAFTSNNEAREYFRGMFSDKKFEDIKVTYTSVDSDEVDAALSLPATRDSIVKRYGIPNDKYLVFCVGQFIDRKGRWTFLEAASIVSRTTSDVVFVWIANSAPNEHDLERAAQFGLGEKFRIITSDEIGDEHIDLFELLKTADSFVLASVREGLPISLIEAMALGVPSISTNINAIPEALVHEKTGLLVEPEDPESLAEAINRLREDEGLAAALSKQGREIVLDKFSDQVIAGIALDAYGKAINDDGK
jgi:glycosyltransferase involved in cell wall biosynthesis